MEFKEFLNIKEITYNKNTDSEYWIKADMENDIFEKMNIYKKGIQIGGALCSLELGKMYLSGQYVRKDLTEAEKYIKYAASCGIADAMFF